MFAKCIPLIFQCTVSQIKIDFCSFPVARIICWNFMKFGIEFIYFIKCLSLLLNTTTRMHTITLWITYQWNTKFMLTNQVQCTAPYSLLLSRRLNCMFNSFKQIRPLNATHWSQGKINILKIKTSFLTPVISNNLPNRCPNSKY